VEKLLVEALGVLVPAGRRRAADGGGPSFRELGQLAAVAAIRTALNYFLAEEIAEERRQLAEERADEGTGTRQARAT
jgi:hypothetical protein